MKKVLITGILGQDGANMADFLLRNPEIEVYGMVRRSATPNFVNIKEFENHSRFRLVFGDLGDEVSINNLVRDIQPDYFINFAANSFVGCSWDMPVQVFDINALGVMRCLEAIRKFKPECRFYSAGSSEEFGNVEYSPQDLRHPIKPRSPYGASKASARHIVKVYRESYNLFAIHSILFNHEGIRRSKEFLTRKVTSGVAEIYCSFLKGYEVKPIEVGNIEAKRDWSDSEDFIEGIWLMLNQSEPKEYVLASGETHSVKEFIELAFENSPIKTLLVKQGYHNVRFSWSGEGMNVKFGLISEEGYVTLVKVNPKFYRPAEVDLLLGDPTLAKQELGWKPKTSFKELVAKMQNHDINILCRADDQGKTQ